MSFPHAIVAVERMQLRRFELDLVCGLPMNPEQSSLRDKMDAGCRGIVAEGDRR
jgi:hypothetical protein